jgi:hypothetical protein
VRTLAITQNVTVDGSIEMLGDWFDPQGQADVDNSDLLRSSPARQQGRWVPRRTPNLRGLRGYWPKQSDDPTFGLIAAPRRAALAHARRVIKESTADRPLRPAGQVRATSAAGRFPLETQLCASLSSLRESRAQGAERSDQRALPHMLDTGGFSTDHQESPRACWWAVPESCRIRTWESPDSE